MQKQPESAWNVLELDKKKKHGTFRLVVQAAAASLSNGYIKGFSQGRIYEGSLKYVCVPGMNCYSCPGALGSCPIGSLQATLNSRDYKISMYVVGFMITTGTLLGRFVCGFLCPFGLIQDLLYKIPFIKKFKKLPGEKFLRWFRFVFLAVFVIILPMFVVDFIGLGEPWFCKYVCPVGMLEGGIPLVLLNKAMRGAIGFLFKWKFSILILTLLLSIILYRPFCRYVCPLGAFYGIFNKFSFIRYKVDPSKCTQCGICQKTCKLDIPVYKKPNSMDCIRCGDCKVLCPYNAITSIQTRPSGHSY